MSQPERQQTNMADRPARLLLMARFHTDGDFRFDLPEYLIDTASPLYEGASPEVSITASDETYEFRVWAQGPSRRCKYAARDALEHLICSIRTFKSYLVGDLYAFLSKPLASTLWTEWTERIHYHDAMSGNYEGTVLTLDIQYIDEGDAGPGPEDRQPFAAGDLAASAAASPEGVPAVVLLDGEYHTVTDAGYDPAGTRFVIHASSTKLD